MARRETFNETIAGALAVALGVTIAAVLLIMSRERSNEKLSAESFASTVVAQNPKVFERLAEM